MSTPFASFFLPLFLRSTNIEVREIAFMVGFSDLPHFIKTFKKHTGKTPSKYRNSAE
jgi:two-component system response regulator YesN